MKVRHTILFVDDEEHNLSTFRFAFFREYTILTANSGAEALALLEQHPVQLVITDQRMPVMTGLDLLAVVRQRYPDVVRIIATGYSDIEVVMRAINELAIFHYVLKPWDNTELRSIMSNGLRTYQLEADKRALLHQLGEANLTLENKVLERTRELAARNEEYQQLNALKDKLFSIISHDLRGPLSSLSAFLETYLSNDGVFNPEETRRILDGMNGLVMSLNDMLQNLLFWSQAQMQQTDTGRTAVSITPLLERHLHVYLEMARQKHIELCLDMPAGEVPVVANADLVSVVLRNLISNAIKFTPANGRITVTAGLSQDCLVLSVTDTGVGIPQAMLDQLFDHGKLITTVGTAQEKGTGLGLKLCREYVEKQGGRLMVQSQVGLGTTFSFTLPLLQPA